MEGRVASLTRALPSLKLTAILHLKMDGWNTIRFLLGNPYFQGRLVSFREGIPSRECFQSILQDEENTSQTTHAAQSAGGKKSFQKSLVGDFNPFETY